MSETVRGSTHLLRQLGRRRWFRRLVVWTLFAAIYEVAAYIVGPFFLPTIQAVIGSTSGLVSDGAFSSLGGALKQMIVGYLVAVVVGVPLGVLIGVSRVADYILGMYVKALFVTSLIAVLPLLITLVGYGFAFRVTVVLLFAIFFIVLNTAAGVRDVDPQLLSMGRSVGASRLRRAVSITLPSSLPFIISGMRVALANSFGGMILAEIWIARDFGQILTGLAYNRDLPKFMELLWVITLLAAFSAAALKAIERRITPWAASRR
jgi:NitT/TauT family transport system permease protein